MFRLHVHIFPLGNEAGVANYHVARERRVSLAEMVQENVNEGEARSFLPVESKKWFPITHGSIENFKTEISFIEADKCYKFTNFSNLHFLKHLISCAGAFSGAGHSLAETPCWVRKYTLHNITTTYLTNYSTHQPPPPPLPTTLSF